MLTSYNDRFAFVSLFEAVNERYSKDYIDKTGWMYSHQWTTKQREDYVVWLANEFLVRKIFELEKEAQNEAMFFVARNGWQINDKKKVA